MAAEAGIKIVAGDTKVVAFEIIDLESPEPRILARLRVRNPRGIVTALTLDVPGIRIAKDKARGGPLANPGVVSGIASVGLFLPLAAGMLWRRSQRSRRQR